MAVLALIPFPAGDSRASISLGFAPNPGWARRIAKSEILNRLALSGKPTDDLVLPDSILVHRQAASLDRDRVTHAILEASADPGASGNESPGDTVKYPTAGRIPIDAKAERAVIVGLPQTVETLELVLDPVDFTTVRRAVEPLTCLWRNDCNPDRRF